MKMTLGKNNLRKTSGITMREAPQQAQTTVTTDIPETDIPMRELTKKRKSRIKVYAADNGVLKSEFHGKAIHYFDPPCGQHL